MLKPLVGNDNPDKFGYVVLDIETAEDGTPTHFGVYDGESFEWGRSCKWAVMKLLKGCDRYPYVYAHCGMLFDYSIVLRQLLVYGDVSLAYSGSQGIYMGFRGYNGETLTFLDSYRLIPGSLAKLSAQFSPNKQKLSLVVMPWELSEDKLLEYLRRDCESLYEVVGEFWRVIDEKFGCTRARTLSSLAMKVYRKKYQTVPLMTANKRLYKYELSSYFGGVCYCEPGKWDVSVWDINSMYPFAMRTYEYPYSYVGAWTREYRGEIGLYKCKYEYEGLPFVFDWKCRSLENKGEGIVDRETFEYIRSIGKIELIEGYEYARCGYLFKEFVDDMYSMRMQYGGAVGYVVKILLNSLYGKFGQKRERRSVSTREPRHMYKVYGMEVGGINREVFDWVENAMVAHSSPVIASLVTLHSRRYLHQLASRCDTVYMDTDSIHVRGASPFEESAELGALKKEYEGKAVYVGKKVYELLDSGIIKCKGVPGKVMKAADLENMLSPRKYEFDSFPSPLRIIKNNEEFRKIVTSRTIKPADVG